MKVAATVMAAEVASHASATKMSAAEVTATMTSAKVSASASTVPPTPTGMSGLGCRYKGREGQSGACGGQHAYISFHIWASLLWSSGRASVLVLSSKRADQRPAIE
jgi:hypothetical protein